jgi:hypothetical protein
MRFCLVDINDYYTYGLPWLGWTDIFLLRNRWAETFWLKQLNLIYNPSSGKIIIQEYAINEEI